MFLLLHSYNALLNVRKLDKTIKIGWLIKEDINQKNILEFMKISGNQICPPADLVSENGIKLARKNNLGVRLWGVSNENIMLKVYNLDIDGMTVNFPDKLNELIMNN
jgi:glycerophosphoryl diester phosphodiesterase